MIFKLKFEDVLRPPLAKFFFIMAQHTMMYKLQVGF